MALNVTTSIVDYLKSVGQDSSFTARQALAKQYGITNYSGTAEQNVKLLQTLRTGATPMQATQPSTQPTPTVQATPQATQQTPVEYNLPPLDTGNVPENYSLPTADISGLSSDQTLAFALRDVAKLAQREGKITGTAAVSTFFANRGIMPEDLPGSSIANMLAVVDRAMVSPVTERVGTLTDLIDSIALQREQTTQIAGNQMKLLMDMGTWNATVDTDPVYAQRLWASAGMSGTPQKLAESPGFSEPFTLNDGTVVQVNEANNQYHVIARPDDIDTESIDWENAEEYIKGELDDIAKGRIGDIATLYAEIKKGTKLTDSDIKALMAKHGMVEMQGIWIYFPSETTFEISDIK